MNLKIQESENVEQEKVNPIEEFFKSDLYKQSIQPDGSIKLPHPMLSLKKALEELKKQKSK